MKFKEAFEKAKQGDRLTYGTLTDSTYITKRRPPYVNTEWNHGEINELLTLYELFDYDTWRIIGSTVEVSIDGKTGFISKQSAEALKRML